jgi:hypothetical protein
MVDDTQKRCVMSLICPRKDDCIISTWHECDATRCRTCDETRVPENMRHNVMCVALGEEVQP